MSYTREEYEAVIKELIDRIVRLQSEEKNEIRRLLLIMCGGKSGAELVPQQIERLSQDGYQMKLVFTEAGRHMFGETWIEQNRLSIPVASEEESFFDLLMEADAVVIPVLTVNTASKIVHGIADERVSTIVMQALLQNKPVIAARNACDPSTFSGTSTKKNLVYYDMLKGNLEKLKQFGIQMINTSQIYEKVRNLVPAAKEAEPIQQLQPVPVPDVTWEPVQLGRVFSNRVLSTGDILKCDSDTIQMARHVIVTPAAREAAKERGIKLIKL